jgi:hypothetical protein
MTEPEKKDGFSVLDAVEEEPKKGGTLHVYFWVFLLLSLGAFSIFKWGIGTGGKDPSAAQDDGTKGDLAQQAQYGVITDFAEKFTIMAFNVSYTDINHQVDKVGNLMSDNMMSYYQEAFLDPKWVAFLSDNKAYVSYQQVERSTVENTDGTHYWVRVIGKCLFNSDARGPGSQIVLPFHIVVVIKSDNGKLIVTNFQRL